MSITRAFLALWITLSGLGTGFTGPGTRRNDFAMIISCFGTGTVSKEMGKLAALNLYRHFVHWIQQVNAIHNNTAAALVI